MIEPVTGWFEITQYDDKIAISIANLVETMWLTRYPIPMEITYDQGSEFIGHEFIKSLIETEYRIILSQALCEILLPMKYWYCYYDETVYAHYIIFGP